MKAGVFSLVLMLTAAVSAAEMPRFNPKAVSPRQIKWDNKIKFQLAADGRAMCEVVTSRNRSTAFAAEELAAFLSRATGAKIPLVKKPSGKVTAFILGAEGAAKLKFDLKKLDRDGYIIKSSGKNIIIAGTDNPRGNPRVRCEFSERGTLNGVYEFLERFCGVRFYFPGDIGTIVPRNRNLTVPGIDIIDRPDNQHRQSYCVGIKTLGNGKLNYYDDAIAPSVLRLAKLRMRESTLNLPNCHGLAELGLVQRFAKSNPEFFALKENGKRHDDRTEGGPSVRIDMRHAAEGAAPAHAEGQLLARLRLVNDAVHQLVQNDVVNGFLGVSHQMIRKADRVFAAAATKSCFGARYLNARAIKPREAAEGLSFFW